MQEAHSDLESARQEAIAIANTLSLINEDRRHFLCSSESFLALRASQLTIMAIEKAQSVLITSDEVSDGLKEAISMDYPILDIVVTLSKSSQALEISLKSMAARLASKPLYKLWVEKAYMNAAEIGYWVGDLHKHIPVAVPEPVEPDKIDPPTPGENETTGPETATGGAVMTVSKENENTDQGPGSTGGVPLPEPPAETTTEAPAPVPAPSTPTQTDNPLPKPPASRVKKADSKKDKPSGAGK